MVDFLPAPLNGIVIEVHPGSTKDFGSARDYPLKSVTFASEYGYLPGYLGEDGVDLDFFVGSQIDGQCGFITVFRPELKSGEHKFYIGMTNSELQQTLQQYKPVILSHKSFTDIPELIKTIRNFKREF